MANFYRGICPLNLSLDTHKVVCPRVVTLTNLSVSTVGCDQSFFESKLLKVHSSYIMSHLRREDAAGDRSKKEFIFNFKLLSYL